MSQLLFPIFLLVLALAVLCRIALTRGLESALPTAAFMLVLLPIECKLSLGFADLTVHRLIVIVLWVIYLTRGKQKSGKSSLPMKGLILAHISWCLVSTAFAIDPTASFKKLLSIGFEYNLLYFIYFKVISQKETIYKILRAMVLALVVCCIFGFFETYWGWSVLSLFPTVIHRFDGDVDVGGELRITSTFDHAILYGAALAMACVIALHLLTLVRRPGQKTMLWIAICLMIFNLYKTGSRGPWLDMIFGGVLLCLIGGKGPRKSLAAIAVLACAVMIIRPGVKDTIVGLYDNTMDTDNAKGASYEYRYALQGAAYKAVTRSFERSILGYGLESFYDAGVEGPFLGEEHHRFRSADDSWVEMMIETGFVGLFLIVTILLKPFFFSLKEFRRLRPPDRYLCSTLLILMFIFYFQMYSVGMYGWGQNGYMLWMLIAIAYAFPKCRKVDGRKSKQLVGMDQGNVGFTTEAQGSFEEIWTEPAGRVSDIEPTIRYIGLVREVKEYSTADLSDRSSMESIHQAVSKVVQSGRQILLASCRCICARMVVCGVVLTWLFGLSAPLNASTVAFVTRAETDSKGAAQVELATKFYGLKLSQVVIDAKDNHQALDRLLHQPDLSAVILTSDTLPALTRDQLLGALRRPGEKRVPIAIIATTAEDSQGFLEQWSGGAVEGCTTTEHTLSGEELSFTADTEFTQELKGSKIPVAVQVPCSPVVHEDGLAKTLVEAREGNTTIPLVVETGGAQSLFVLADASAIPGAKHAAGSLPDKILVSLPMMMFLRFAAGDRAWHTVGHFANLTVDDAWLTEPYGNLSYDGLVEEMKRHSFHTTIAFIPWNYDRSEPSVVSLFKEHPDLLSICIHGNNHDHREFGDYKHVSLEAQKYNLGQALARMEEFHRLTGISYDPVMVFPHAVSPTETFRQMKAYNYWATTNSESIPLNGKPPADPLFSFRPETLAFSNFLSIKRYSAEFPVSPSLVAVESYLGNPLLFYVHQEFFFRNIGAFDTVADTVNRIAPGTKWTNLGEIVQNLYLLRRRDDGNFDVRAYSPKFNLSNPENRTVTFHILKSEDSVPAIHAVKVNGKNALYKVADGELALDLTAEPRQVLKVDVTYENDLQLPQVDITKKGLWITALRTVSDFRDRTLTTSGPGMKLTAFYYSHGLDSVERSAERSKIALLILLLAALGYWSWRARRRPISHVRTKELKRHSSVT